MDHQGQGGAEHALGSCPGPHVLSKASGYLLGTLFYPGVCPQLHHCRDHLSGSPHL